MEEHNSKEHFVTVEQQSDEVGAPEAVNTWSVGRILANSTTQTDMDDGYHLPEHLHCCSHIVNLVGNIYNQQALTCEPYNRLSKTVFINSKPYGIQFAGILKHQISLKNWIGKQLHYQIAQDITQYRMLQCESKPSRKKMN
jgi:hypothetical protein